MMPYEPATDPEADRAVATLQTTRRVALSLTELARSLGYSDPASLRDRLARDPRLCVLEARGFPLPEAVPAPTREAFRAAGLEGAVTVALTVPPDQPARGCDTLLRRTTARLLVLRPESAPALVQAAQGAHDAVVAALRPAP